MKFRADTAAVQESSDLSGMNRLEKPVYESFATVGEIRVWWRADFQSGSRVLKKVF